MSERILAQSAAERDRISEIKDKAVELETEPKFANCCGFCPKSFKKPSDLVRYSLLVSQCFWKNISACNGALKTQYKTKELKEVGYTNLSHLPKYMTCSKQFHDALHETRDE